MYGDDVNIIAKNGSSAKWFLSCGSNGATNKATATAINSEIEYMQTTNRGPVNDSELVVKDSVVKDFLLLKVFAKTSARFFTGFAHFDSAGFAQLCTLPLIFYIRRARNIKWIL